jgi:ferredoxin
MKAEVFLFSGTGNSFAVARDIARALDAQLIPIGSLLDEDTVTTEAPAIIVVFPRYYGSNDVEIPLAVKKFLLKLRTVERSRIFAVCTYGGGVGTVFTKVDEILKAKGSRLSAGYGVHMPQNAFRKPFENIPRLLQEWNQRKARICSDITIGKEGHFDRDGVLFRLLARVLKTFVDFRKLEKRSIAKCAHLSEDLPIEKLMPFVDSSYEVDNSCNGCGVCVKVCPVNNVRLVEGRPSWQHRCENCLACCNWCPRSAIHGGVAEGYRYCHPEGRVSELARQN